MNIICYNKYERNDKYNCINLIYKLKLISYHRLVLNFSF